MQQNTQRKIEEIENTILGNENSCDLMKEMLNELSNETLPEWYNNLEVQKKFMEGKKKQFYGVSKDIQIKLYPIFENLFKSIENNIKSKYTKEEIEEMDKKIIPEEPMLQYFKRVPVVIGQYLAILQEAGEPINISLWYNKERIAFYINFLKKLGRKAKTIRNHCLTFRFILR